MIIRKINDNLQITGEVYSNSRAWGHEVKAIYHGREVEKNRVRYYNRTWERYQFESAWQGLLAKLDQKSKEGAWSVPLSDRVAFANLLNAGYESSLR